MEQIDLAPGYRISRVIRGGWQLAGGHGDVDRDATIADLMATAEAGITTFDCADIYTGVEAIMGDFRARWAELHGQGALDGVRVHTKCVPDLAMLDRLQRSDIEAIVDTSLKRLRAERLDLVQFHWWDYDKPRWRDAARWLADLRGAGKIENLGATNFDAQHTRDLAAEGFQAVTAQLQYSVIDDRPAGAISDAAGELGFKLLCYGTVAGGFLSDRWLGQAEPTEPLENRSLTKYKLIIDDRGGWEPFQALLSTLRQVADRHDSDIATVASRFVLDLPHVAAVIVGARHRDHLEANLRIGALRLTDDDRSVIEAARSDMRPLAGDVYGLERDRDGRHGRIIKYNLNTEAPAS